MSETDIKDIIRKELPEILKEDTELRALILDLAQSQFADKQVTESRFDRVLDEIRRDREAQSAKWAEQSTLWAEQSTLWAEQNKRWEENQNNINDLIQEMRSVKRNHESTIGALGARWGIRTEASFRNALKAILEESFDVEVIHVNEFDTKGEVFYGRPDQVELDLFIKNGTLIIGEIKSPVSRSEMHTFNRKVDFYEKMHNQKANRRIIISPMVDPRAKRLADQLGIETYSYAEDVVDL